MSKGILVIGASGGLGSAIAAEQLRRREPVVALARDEARLRRQLAHADPGGLLSVKGGSALDSAGLLEAAEGCSAIVHAVNLPYAQWSPGMERVTMNVVAAARCANAPILFPGNVYGLGPPTNTPFGEQAPDRPCCDLGRLRVKLETMLRTMSQERGAPGVLIVRAGDYFGPSVRNGLVDRLFARAIDRQPIQALGDLSRPHQWAFVPDLARAMLDLLALRSRLDHFAVVNFPGHTAKPARGFLELVAARAGRATLEIKTLPWWTLRLAGLWDANIRALLTLRYLWDQGVLLDGSLFARLLPRFEPTPLELAVDQTIAAYRRDQRTDAH